MKTITRIIDKYPRPEIDIVSRETSHDALREALNAFIREHLREDLSQVPWVVPPGELARKGMPSITVYAKEETTGHTRGVVNGVGWLRKAAYVEKTYGSASVDLARALLTQTLYIDSLAVDPASRRDGVGSWLLQVMCEIARKSQTIGAAIVDFDSRIEGLQEFYEKNDFTVLPDQTLKLQFAGLDHAFKEKQNDPDYRTAVRVLNPHICRIVLKTGAFGNEVYVPAT